MYRGLRWYWKRKGYEKLGGRRRRGNRVELGSGRKKTRRVWRIRVAPKLGFLRRAVAAPRRLLVWLRDAYVRLMLGFANSRVCSAGYGGGLGLGGGDGAAGGFGRGPAKEYDERMIVEIYKSIVMQAQGQLVHRDAPNKIASGIVARR